MDGSDLVYTVGGVVGVDSVLVYGRDSGNHITDDPSAPLDPWDYSRQWAVNRNMGSLLCFIMEVRRPRVLGGAVLRWRDCQPGSPSDYVELSSVQTQFGSNISVPQPGPVLAV